jgi:hypothetical protein
MLEGKKGRNLSDSSVVESKMIKKTKVFYSSNNLDDYEILNCSSESNQSILKEISNISGYIEHLKRKHSSQTDQIIRFKQEFDVSDSFLLFGHLI